MNFFELVSSVLQSHPEAETLISLLEKPLDRTMGDVALPCFQLAKTRKKAPQIIAQDIAGSIVTNESIEKIEAVGPYVNFFVSTTVLTKVTIDTISNQQKRYGSGSTKDTHILVESPGPNTNKPLHLGHVRNMLLGNALAAILEYAGHKVTKVDIVNDRGVHICKSMLAYQRFGNNALPNKKSDHYVGDWYVKYAQESANDTSREQAIHTMLEQREKGDPEVRELWETMRKRALDGHAATYTRYGTIIDKAYYESNTYLHGKEMVELGLQKDVFSKDEKGNIIYSNPDQGIDKKVVLRSNGTSVYITQDLYLAKQRNEEYAMDAMIYVVGNEQEYHFKVLFEILKSMGYAFANNCYHLGYGMISLPEGKMKSREGTVVDADNLADDMHEEAFRLLQERGTIGSEEELHAKAEAIAMAAIKFFILKYDALKDFTFDPNTSLRFDGETGPYLQYTHARCCSILNKKQPTEEYNPSLLTTDEERLLMIHLHEFPEVVQEAADRYQPYLVARYVLDLCHLFNTYYQAHKILIEDDAALEITRLHLVQSVKQVIANGLGLLGITVLDHM